MTNGSWIVRSTATQTNPDYYLNSNTTNGWTLNSDTFTLQKNTNGTITVNSPRLGIVTATIVETDTSGQAIIDQMTGQPTANTYPAGSRMYNAIGGQSSIDHYRLFADSLSAVTDMIGNALTTTINTTTQFCTQDMVFKPITPVPVAGDNYNVYSQAWGCTLAGITGATTTTIPNGTVMPTGTVLLATQNTGNSSVSSVIIIKSSASMPWLVNAIVSSVNGKTYLGVYKPAGANVGASLYGLNKTAAAAEAVAAFPGVSALP